MFDTDRAKKIGVTEAILLYYIEQTIHIYSSNGKNFYNDKYWIYGSSKAFTEIFTYLSRQQIARALKRLVDDGWLIKDNFNTNPFDRTSWYSLSDKYNVYYTLKNEVRSVIC